MIVPRRVLSRTPNRSGPTAQRHLRALPADLGEAASANRRIPRCRRLLWDQLLSYQFERSLGPKLRNEKKTDSCVSVAADRKSGARVSASRQCPRKQSLISGRPPGALNFSLLVAAAAATFRASKWTPPGHSLHKALRNNHVC
ncbi:hypothetical protein MTO96_005054 [Rhipicephalus appendiculatus]